MSSDPSSSSSSKDASTHPESQVNISDEEDEKQSKTGLLNRNSNSASATTATTTSTAVGTDTDPVIIHPYEDEGDSLLRGRHSTSSPVHHAIRADGNDKQPPHRRRTSLSKNEDASKHDRSCDLPFFDNNDSDNDHDEEPLMGEWQVKAAAAVVRYRESSKAIYKTSPWSWCSLSFKDEQAEAAFRYYFSQLNEHKLRRRLLLLNFVYMVYATVEWGSRNASSYTTQQQSGVTVLRALYILINMMVFTISYTNRAMYRRNINLFSTILSLLTSCMIIFEGFLLRNIYSPFVLILLIMYMVASNVYVKTLYTVSIFICCFNLILYDLVCVFLAPNGDRDTVKSGREATKQLLWYNFILIFFILTIMFLTRRVEKQSRYSFLLYYLECEEEEKRRKAEAEAAAAAGGSDGATGQGSVTGAVAGISGADVHKVDQGTNPMTHRSLEEDQTQAGSSTGQNDQQEEKSSSSNATNTNNSVLFPTTSTDGRITARGGRSLLPRTREEELALLQELNEYEAKEDPFFLNKLTNIFTPPGKSSNDPLSSTLSIMRSKGVTSLTEFVRVLKQQGKNRPTPVGPRLCMCDELPPYFTSYPYVYTGYRTNYTAMMCVKSLFEWHNETINCWTEFGPMFLFAIALGFLEYHDPVISKASSTDQGYIIAGLIMGLIIRPICSGLAHMFFCISQRAYVLWWSIDYVSILFAILGYGLVCGRFTFYCMTSQQVFFIISVIVLLLSTIASVLFVASPGIRTSSFVLYVLFANGVPFIYQVVLKLSEHAEYDVPDRYLGFWILMWSFMILGMIVKTIMIPERWFPGRFDIFASSHQWWHLLINCGAATSYFAWKEYLRWRPTATCPASPSWGA